MNHNNSFIQPFCNFTGVPVTYYNTNAVSQWEYCPNEKICSFHHADQEHLFNCKKTLISSANMAAQLGEPYIFLCQSGLINIVIPFMKNGRIKGMYVAGPIPMGYSRETIIKNIMKGITLEPEALPKLILFLSQMKIFSPNEISDLSCLFNSTVLYALNEIEEYLMIKENFKEESQFGEQIQKYKKQNKQLDYPQELEDLLIQKVRIGDVKSMQTVLAELLEAIFLVECGDLSFIKVRVLGICSILTRITAKRDVSFQVSFKEIENLYLLNEAQSFKDLCRITARICENICTSVKNFDYSGNSSIISNACQYIRDNHPSKITLKAVANELYVNPSYLSALFKKETGKGFTQYINDIRLKHSRDLLANTSLSLVDIAASTGFDCQSYFTKVFKNNTGLTPSEYRKTKDKA